MSKKHEKVYRALIYFEHFTFVYAATNCVSVSAFASLVSVRVGITSSTAGLKICLINTVIKKFRLIIEKTRKKHDRIKLLRKANLGTI